MFRTFFFIKFIITVFSVFRFDRYERYKGYESRKSLEYKGTKYERAREGSENRWKTLAKKEKEKDNENKPENIKK